MLKSFLSFVLLFLIVGMSYAQFSNDRPDGLAPYKKDMNPISITVAQPDNLLSFNSRAFGYNAVAGTTPKGPCKFFLNTPTTLTSIAADAGANFLCSGSFDGSGNWFAIRYGTNEFYKVDTSTGVLTQLGTATGASLNGMGWDPSTSTMYVCSSNGTTLQLGTINLTNGAVTMIGSSVSSLTVIDIAFSNAGVCYGHRFGSASGSNSEIITINKSTNAITVVGTTGFPAWYAQGMSWDRGVDSGYLAAYNVTAGQGQLYKINTATGSCTLIGLLGAGASTEVDAFAIPGAAGPLIQHTPLPNTQNVAGPYVVNAVVSVSGTTIASSKIFWSRNSTTITDSVTMTNSSGNNWTGNIPGNGSAAVYRYYIKALDALGRAGFHPGGAPATVNMFTASAVDTVKPVIVHTPIGNTAKCSWPIAVSASVTDNLGIDSVWVRWKKGANGTTKQFKLLPATLPVYTAIFNSTNGEVNVGDSIFYRVVAQDNSAQHLKDSTALISFKFLAGNDVVTLGTGSVAMGSASGPFNTYWYGNRTQFLYTKEELMALGGCPAPITKIGFQISVVASQVMNGFNINFQHTSATSLTGFVTSGWTNAYTGTYTVPATGWQDITLQTPFVWNGTQNILVEVCFGNTSYTSATTVLGTTMAGMEWSQYADISTACTTFTAGAAQAARANTRFTFLINGVTPVGGAVIPTTYSLSQNYPNPFNPVTRINFAIPKQGLVNLKIYDVLGREIKTLVNEVKTPGVYSVDFNASEYSSGVYFYKLESNGFVDTKRMMLIK